MKSIQVELPEKLARELDEMVKEGWFKSGEEAVRAALLEFVRRHHLELMERFQREDIGWAIKQTI